MTLKQLARQQNLSHQTVVSINNITFMTNIRIVPVQKLCILCSEELPAHDAVRGLAARLCRTCLGVISERVYLRELEQEPQPKIVRV